MDSDHALVLALKYRIEVDRFGTQWLFNSNNQLHCEDGPAVLFADGSKIWIVKGLRHRVDGPAAEYADGTCEYWRHGMPVRESPNAAG